MPWYIWIAIGWIVVMVITLFLLAGGSSRHIKKQKRYEDNLY